MTKAYLSCEMSSPEIIPFSQGNICIYSDKSPSKEAENEDAIFISSIPPDSGVLAIADGLGGHKGGAIASKTVVKSVQKYLRNMTKNNSSIRESVLNAIDYVNEKISKMKMGSGSTLALVELIGNSFRSYHIGDSSIFVVGQKGQEIFQTIPHSPTGYALESGLIDESEALNHEDRHLISNALGSGKINIEMSSIIKLKNKDTILLGSDGLFDNLSKEEIIQIIRKGKLEEIGVKLVELCKFRMTHNDTSHPSKPDDLSFILYRAS